MDRKNDFQTQVVPFLNANCLKCHGQKEPKGDLSLESFRESANIQKSYDVWVNVVKMLAEKEMPPRDEPQPPADETAKIIKILEAEIAAYKCIEVEHPGRVTIRRLNRVEYNNTIRDLLGLNFKPADDFPSDDVGYGFDNIGDVLTMPPILLEKYLAAAEKIADQLFHDANLRHKIFPAVEEGAAVGEAFLRAHLPPFIARAFRRPATNDEIDRFVRIGNLVRERGGSADESLQAVCIAALVSPHFLFRVERDPDPADEDGIRDIDGYELASRLSYFLWSSMPDEELFSAAKDGTLRSPDVLAVQCRRMLLDPRSSLVKNFAGQWLQLRDLKNMTPDPGRFPDFDESLRAAMYRETELFFETIIREDRSVLEFINADFSFVNERLAKHYRIPDVQGEEFRRVSLDDRRRGVLTQGSILLLTSNPTRTSPVKRGKWILENILGDPPPPPPVMVEELKDEGELLGTLRERMEQHRLNEACAVCHRKMDTLGFGLENYDAIGAWRDEDSGAAVNASGTLPGGKEFANPKDLMQILSTQRADDFCRCLTQKMLTYALGRGLQSEDRCAVEAIQENMKKNQHKFSSLIQAIVTSDPFLKREVRREAP